MKTIETERLILRKFTEDDFAAVHSYAACLENVVYMPFGPNREEDTRSFINNSIVSAEADAVTNYQFAAILKETGKLIGGCGYGLRLSGDEAEAGWILHRDYWKRGFGAEMGEALLKFGFEELKLHRITAHCDAENTGSYRIMEKIGMRREGLFIEARPANKLSDKKYGDELCYAILKDEWETRREIEYYNSLPCVFEGFIDLPELSDGEIFLVCEKKSPGNIEKNLVPAYHFAICRNSERIGEIALRIGYSERLYFGGQIGYNVDEGHRGRSYAGRACRLIIPVAKAHGMKKLIITNNPENAASVRVCEKLGARLIRAARLPEGHDLRAMGRVFQNIFEWDIL